MDEAQLGRRSRLVVAGILVNLLEYSAADAMQAASRATPEQREAIQRAARWPIREQARGAVRHHVQRIRQLTTAPLRVFPD